MLGLIRRKNTWYTLVAIILVLISARFVLRGTGLSLASTGASDRGQDPASVAVAAPGRVEPVSEDVKLSTEINGKLDKVLVEEGDNVHKGQLLAVLVNDDYRAQVAAQQATLAQKQAEERRTRNGARTEERREAEAAVTAQEAILEDARGNMERYQKLFEGGATSQEEADRYLREYKVAKAQYDQATQHSLFVSEDTRQEDRDRVSAEVALASAQLEQSRALYAKTFIRAPIDGAILRRYHRAGESVSNSSSSPDPIFALGSRGALRVRADVDESDIARVHVGDRAYVTADAFGGKKFWGQVVRLGGELGRKNIRTDEPSERVDTKILETLVKLDDGQELPIGLRVDTFILTKP